MKVLLAGITAAILVILSFCFILDKIKAPESAAGERPAIAARARVKILNGYMSEGTREFEVGYFSRSNWGLIAQKTDGTWIELGPGVPFVIEYKTP